MRYSLLGFPLSDDPRRCIRRTRGDCRSRAGCRFCRSGSSRFVGDFRRLRWSSCIPVPRGRSCRIVSIGNDSMVFAVVERPFFAEVVAALEHFAVGSPDKTHEERQRPTLSQPAVAYLFGIVAALPNKGKRGIEDKVGLGIVK